MGRRRRTVVSVLAGAVVTVIAAQVVLFVLPAGDAPTRADVVIVLAGPGERLERGEQLVAEGFADVLVVATETPENCSPDAPRVQICFEPDPPTTRGEAREIAALAREHGWNDVLVVAQNEQARRARIRLERCLGEVDLTVVTVRATPVESAFRVVYESGALLKALVLEPSC
jgi:uncharacterized SAM-binding protein YcdF (DUF218 family)